MSGNKGVSVLYVLYGISTPSVLVLLHSTNEAHWSLFPVCGLCLLRTVLSFMIQLTFPFSVPVTKHPKPAVSLTESKTAGGCGLGLSSLKQ